MEACCGSPQATQSQGASTFNHRYRQEGLTQTHRVFCACCTLYFALWLTYAGSSILDQETFRTAAYGLTTVTGLNWLVLLALYCSPTAKAHSDAVFTGTCAIMVSVATWTLPLTQQDAPKDVFDLVNRESGLLQATASPGPLQPRHRPRANAPSAASRCASNPSSHRAASRVPTTTWTRCK